MKNRIGVQLVVTLCLFALAAHAAPLGTGFTYQGRLTDSGVPANGSYDLTFQLFDAATNGAPVGLTVTNAGVAVANGLFVTSLDFGGSVFDGSARWLEISAKTNGAAAFTALSPRQALPPTPHALFASNAATANGVVANSITPTQLRTPNPPSNGLVLSFNGTSLIWTNASTVASAWSLNGNAGTTPGVNFLGTTDNQPLELRVNSQRALRLEPTADTGGAVNVIGGSSGNFVAPGNVGATIAGGGSVGISGSNGTNSVAANFGTISGGKWNVILQNSQSSIIGGGEFNTIEALAAYATVGGGIVNTVQKGAIGSTIGGGNLNNIRTNASYSALLVVRRTSLVLTRLDLPLAEAKTIIVTGPTERSPVVA